METYKHTVKEDYVSFEVAKLLKDKGFDEKCNSYFISDDEVALIPTKRDFNNNGIYISAPTHQMAMKWLREFHNISCRPRYDEVEDEKGHLYYAWFFDILSMNPYKTLVEPEQGYSTYEQACEAAIKYCLIKLI